MTVPPEAVTAAALVLADVEGDDQTYRDLAYDVLTAAAPVMATHAVRTASAEMFENAIRAATDDVMAQKLPQIETAARAAERERIRQLLLRCRKCDRIHEQHQAVSRTGPGKPFEYQSWAAADGHAYQAPRLGHVEIADLLADSAPAIPTGGTE